jgi:hypothetical protein
MKDVFAICKQITLLFILETLLKFDRVKKMKNHLIIGITLVGTLFISNALQAATVIGFESGVISGTTSYGFDSNGDSIDDVIFSTEDPAGFTNEVVDPNLQLDFIAGAVLGGSTTNPPNLRVDFVNGVSSFFSFNYVFFGTEFNQIDVSVFDSNNNLLLFSSKPSGDSSGLPLPNGDISLNYTGIASYALIDLSNGISPRYGIDEFNGTFSSNDLPEFDRGTAVPIPAAAWLFGSAIIGLFGIRRKRLCEQL